MSDFDTLVADVLAREGGYSNHSDDRGGATNYGITQAVFSTWLASHGLQWRSVRTLTQDEASRIYFELYWKNARCDALPLSVRDIHFDAAVNHGVRRAALLLQAAAAATQDGAIGPKTLSAVAAINPDLLRMRYIAMRYRFYGSIVQHNRGQLIFMAGWMARMEAFS